MANRFLTGWLLASSLLLTACASSPEGESRWQDPEFISQRLEQARQAYTAERYEVAQALLQPMAVRGIAPAQYSLGYLYFNGQGVGRDRTLAIQWFQRAATQGNAKAIEALARIAQGSPAAR